MASKTGLMVKMSLLPLILSGCGTPNDPRESAAPSENQLESEPVTAGNAIDENVEAIGLAQNSSSSRSIEGDGNPAFEMPMGRLKLMSEPGDGPQRGLQGPRIPIQPSVNPRPWDVPRTDPDREILPPVVAHQAPEPARPAIDPNAVSNGELVPSLVPLNAVELAHTKEPWVSNGIRVSEDAQDWFTARIAYATDPRDWMPPEAALQYAALGRWQIEHVCGGSLVKAGWILTAAHCVSQGHFDRGLTVALGIGDISKPHPNSTYPVDRIVIHKGFRREHIYNYDIALVHIRIDPDRQLDPRIRPIALAQGSEPPAGTPGYVEGWGRVRQDGLSVIASSSPTLMKGAMNIIPVTVCARLSGYGPVANGPTVHDGSLCAGDTQSSTCGADSGGPLYAQGSRTLLGIISWNRHGDRCSTSSDGGSESPKPSVFTRVSAYKGWISRAIAMGSDGPPVQYVE